MKRAIKFRGKGFDGKWVYGSLIITTDPKKEEDIPFGYFIHTGPNISVPVPVDPKTVGQLTDVFDQNGVYIHEGDIVITQWTGKEEIVFQRAAFRRRDEDGKVQPLRDHHGYTIIGTIHDNSELLTSSGS